MIKKINFFGDYYVDFYGNIYNKDFKILSQSTKKNGYKSITLNKSGLKKTFLGHRIVASSFCIGDTSKDVNHINGVKSGNMASNLEFVTKSQNIAHAYKIGLIKMSGENHPASKLSEFDVINIKSMVKYGMKQINIAKHYNVSKQTISAIIRGRNWAHQHRQ